MQCNCLVYVCLSWMDGSLSLCDVMSGVDTTALWEGVAMGVVRVSSSSVVSLHEDVNGWGEVLSVKIEEVG